MAKGEMFLSGKMEKKKYDNKPIPAADYDLKLVGSKAEIRRAQPKKENPTPQAYVTVPFQALGTAADGGKDRFVFHRFFLSMAKRKDGSIGPQMADQLVGLAEALGVELKAGFVQDNGVQCVSAKDVLNWLKSMDGEVVRGHVRIQRATDDYPASNVIAEFFEKEGGSDTSSDEEEAEEEDEETDETEEDEEGDEDEADEDEDADESDEDDEEDDDEDEDELDAAAGKKGKAKGKPAKKKGKR